MFRSQVTTVPWRRRRTTTTRVGRAATASSAQTASAEMVAILRDRDPCSRRTNCPILSSVATRPARASVPPWTRTATTCECLRLHRHRRLHQGATARDNYHRHRLIRVWWLRSHPLFPVLHHRDTDVQGSVLKFHRRLLLATMLSHLGKFQGSF